jgi:hypothetical protein
MRFNIVAVSKSPDAYSMPGKGTFQPYTLFGTFEGNSDPEYVVIHKKADSNAPRQGDSLECTVDSVPVDIFVKDKVIEAKRIRGVFAQPGQSPAPVFQMPAAPAQNAPYEPSDRQESIQRQNSLTNAVALSIARSEVCIASKMYDDAAGHLAESAVILLASELALYNAGKSDKAITVDSVEDMFSDDPGPISPC